MLLKIEPQALFQIDPQMSLKADTPFLLKLGSQPFFKIDPRLIIKIYLQMLLKRSSTNLTQKVIYKPI